MYSYNFIRLDESNNYMKRGYKFLIIGTIVLIFGISLGGISVISMWANTENEQRDYTINKSIITDDNPLFKLVPSNGNEEIHVVLYDMQPEDSRINITIKAEDGTILLDKTAQNQLVDDFYNPKTAGSLHVSIANLGTEPVTISGIIGSSSPAQEVDPEITTKQLMKKYAVPLYSVVSGVVISFVGIAILIIGVVIFFKDRMKKSL